MQVLGAVQFTEEERNRGGRRVNALSTVGRNRRLGLTTLSLVSLSPIDQARGPSQPRPTSYMDIGTKVHN